MNLYLLRHGEAETAATSPAGRQLTMAGRDEVADVARQFAARKLTLDRCYVSPALRAQQTAATFLDGLVDPPVQETLEVLDASNRAANVLAAIRDLDTGNVLLVGHNPILSELLAVLTDSDIDHLRILGTGNLAGVVLDHAGPGQGTCTFILEPDTAREAAS